MFWISVIGNHIVEEFHHIHRLIQFILISFHTDTPDELFELFIIHIQMSIILLLDKINHSRNRFQELIDAQNLRIRDMNDFRIHERWIRSTIESILHNIGTIIKTVSKSSPYNGGRISEIIRTVVDGKSFFRILTNMINYRIRNCSNQRRDDVIFMMNVKSIAFHHFIDNVICMIANPIT